MALLNAQETTLVNVTITHVGILERVTTHVVLRGISVSSPPNPLPLCLHPCPLQPLGLLGVIGFLSVGGQMASMPLL